MAGSVGPEVSIHHAAGVPRIDKDAALAVASVPTLLMCLAHLTGDDRWIGDPYLPERDVNLFHDETGGLPPDVQAEVREAISAVLDELAAGTRTPAGTPSAERMVAMMRACVAEDVAPEYAPLMLEELGLVDRDVHWSSGPAVPPGFRVLVIGAGFAGICASIKLAALGVPHVVVDKNPDLGGTWFDNDYPDAGVDTPNHFYSYSFAPNPHWRHYFSKRAEIRAYADSVARAHGVTERTRHMVEVTSMTWNENDATWDVEMSGPDGTVHESYSAVITAVGQLNRPNLAPARGIESFCGPWFHSAAWDRAVDLAGARVAVIGTGASAMQFLPTVAATAESVVVFQRSPQWVRPSVDYHREVSPETRWLMENVPHYARWYRFGLFWRFGDGLLRTLRRDPDWPHPERSMNRSNDRHRRQLTEHLERELEGRPDLVAKCLPDYPPYGKRILVDNDWYATLRRDNVELVAAAVDRITATGIIDAEGTEHDVDVIILATGFEAGRLLAPMTIRGRSGVRLRDVWGDDDPRAHLGVSVPDYPNMFVLIGPNTFVAHGGSIIFQAECSMRHVAGALVHMCEAGLASLEVRREVHDEYNARVDAEHEQLVWAHPGMRNWYRNAAGRVFSPMPWRFVDYWQMTHDFDPTEYVGTPR